MRQSTLSGASRPAGLVSRVGFISLFSIAMVAVVAASGPKLAVQGQAISSKLAVIAAGTQDSGSKVLKSAAVASTEQVSISVGLNLQDAAGLQKFVDGVSNPISPTYRQFISPEEVGQRFGATQADVDAVVSYLKSNGLTVTLVPKNHMVILATGTAAQMQTAFNTQLKYVTVGTSLASATTYRTPATPAQVPLGLASKIQSVHGLDTSTSFVRKSTTTLNPTLFRSVYSDALPYSYGWTGKGVNIAIANWDGFRLNNVPLYVSAWGLPTPAAGAGSNITVKIVGGTTGLGSTSPQAEGDLDIQMVLNAAPLANVYVYDDYYLNNTHYDTAQPISTLTQIANDNIADIVTESYGWHLGASTAVQAHNLHLAMNAQGITYMSASGDAGTNDFSSSVTRYPYPTIDPEVLQVGGSVANVNSSTGARVSEVSWGLSGGVGGTGGFDPYDTVAGGFTFNVPGAYQKSSISSLTSTYNYRLVPDIASHSGSSDGTSNAYPIYFNNGTTSYPLGKQIYLCGTSCASPATAGGIGVVLQRLFANVTPTSTRANVRLGRLQDYLYYHGSNSSIFYDITSGSSIGNLPGTSTAAVPTAGWDFATGWGAINFDGLYHSFLGGKRP